MSIILLAIFILGIVAVALEDKIGVNKAATALLMAVCSWIVISLNLSPDEFGGPFVEHLGVVSETLFFVLGALTIIELVDSNGGFQTIISFIKTTNKRRLLWIISIMTFILSAMLDNIAAAVIIIAIIRKLIPTREERLIFACMTIITANAGGSFSPIGDVTTILLWTGGNISALHQISNLILPAIVCMIVPLYLVSLKFKKHEKWDTVLDPDLLGESDQKLSHTSRIFMVIWAVLIMISVPVFQQITSLPPFMRILAGLALLWIYTDIMYRRNPGIKNQMHMCKALSKTDLSTILFFLGILMTVAALETSGILTQIGMFLSESIENPLGVSFLIGVMSSFVDNVALVAATQGMYPVTETGTYMMDSTFWTFLSYCAVTGGSLLIIGSATGVTIMGIEKISFVYYLKRFSLYAVIGYVAGAATYLLLM